MHSRHNLTNAFIDICGRDNVSIETDDIINYGKDCTLNLQYPFDVLVKPGTVEEISAIVKLCNEYKISLTPRGGGSGVTGGALPINRGVVLSLERLNAVIEVNEHEKYVIAESGVVTANLCEAVQCKGLYFPVIPSSSSVSFIGGNVALNSGSIHSYKYGSVADYVLNLEIVLPSGEVFWTNTNVRKNSTGIDVTQLFVGSEGVLGIITKVVFRLIRKPRFECSLLAGFENLSSACIAVDRIRQLSYEPAAVEIICQSAIKMTSAYLAKPLPLVKENVTTHILISFHEPSRENIEKALEAVVETLKDLTHEEILVGTSTAEIKGLWELRFAIGLALTDLNRYYRDIDISLPSARLLEYLTYVEAVCRTNNIAFACFGHAMDGNPHVMIVPQDDEQFRSESFEKTVKNIYSYAMANGGAISGEHGIGILQKEYMRLQFSQSHLTLMKALKLFFDPSNIMNPSKIY